jgi:hypothetical protein
MPILQRRRSIWTQLIKFSYKGGFKPSELSQGISGAQIFEFSKIDKRKSDFRLERIEGQYAKLSYIER